MSEVQNVRLEKSKHVHIDVGGADAANLHFHAGNKDTAEAIMAKLESSRAIAGGGSPAAPAANGAAPSPPAEPIERPRSSAAKSVHFAQDEPEEIPPAETYEDEEEEHDTRSIRSFESMMSSRSQHKRRKKLASVNGRQSITDRLASMPGLSRLSGSAPHDSKVRPPCI